MQRKETDIVDLFVIGGGVNGCAIARDAAGRGLRVTIAEMGDLASATSSASTKLFHGGLRYLEYFEFGLVKKALIEREILLANMPHISRPMRFILPLSPDMTFDATTPTSRLLGLFMPWLKGRRPNWLIRLGLFLYDTMGGRKFLPGTKTLNLGSDPAGQVLKDGFKKAFEYSDCVVDDARLVVLLAADATQNGAHVRVRTMVTHATQSGGLWEIETLNKETGDRQVTRARALVNASGPWVEQVIEQELTTPSPEHIRLVRGSHIVVPSLFEHGRAYYFQGSDGRLVFAIPFQQNFTLIGTTEAAHHSPDEPARISDEETAYLCDFASRYFRTPVRPADIVWSYSGVRPLFDEGADSATSATRDYKLVLELEDQAPVLHIFGGKITTHRVLAESALEKLQGVFPEMGDTWTSKAPLPGGDFPVDGFDALVQDLKQRHPFLSDHTADRMIRAYGTLATDLIQGASSAKDLGVDFGAGLFEREVRWMMDNEFALSAEDVAWRRSKLGLVMSTQEIARLETWMKGAKNGA